MRSLWEKNLKIAFLTVAPFIVKFRFEKYRYLLTHLLCLQIFEVLLSDKHSTGPRNGRLVPLPVACLVWWYSFRPQIYDESETDQILNAKYFVWKNYTMGKWGLREAVNQNCLMQLFNWDRRIVQCHGNIKRKEIVPTLFSVDRCSYQLWKKPVSTGVMVDHYQYQNIVMSLFQGKAVPL